MKLRELQILSGHCLFLEVTIQQQKDHKFLKEQPIFLFAKKWQLKDKRSTIPFLLTSYPDKMHLLKR
jgi:hypothetical protein